MNDFPEGWKRPLNKTHRQFIGIANKIKIRPGVAVAAKLIKQLKVGLSVHSKPIVVIYRAEVFLRTILCYEVSKAALLDGPGLYKS